MKKVAFITGITGQDGAYLAELLLKKNYIVHGLKRRSSSFNTGRIDHLYQDPHVKEQNFFLHHGDLTDSTNLIRIIQMIQPDEIYNLAAQSHVQVSFETPEYTANADALGTLRIHLAEILDLRNPEVFAPLWVLDFPLLEWDEETKKYHAMHHPFTSPKPDDVEKLDTNPAAVRANAYDLVINGNEIGGGSIRIHDKALQQLMFKHLGFTEKEAKEQFGFLMEAFEYGAPPHGGVAFGFDRLCAIMGGQESIRDFIAFPKNNAGRDIMIDSPSNIDKEQLNELNIKLKN